jgi:hypothetical protein
MVVVGSREFWRDRESYEENWQSRSAQAASFIAPDSTVLDIGCGPHMTLRNYLARGCTYIPADLYQWTPEVRRVDVDNDIFPSGKFDFVVLLGVIEYLTKAELVFAFAREHAASMVVSYCHPKGTDAQRGDGLGWVNAFSVEDFRNLLAKSEWRMARSETFRQSAHVHQMIHWLLPIGKE